MKIVYPTWLELQFNDNDGNPLSLGRIYTYKSGVGSLANTYNENDQVNSNPVILDANGRATIRLDSSFAYKFEVRDKNNVLIYERDKVYGSEVVQTEDTNDHDQLINRELANQHPTSAVTGLDTALSAITGDVSQLIIDVTNLNGNKVNRSGDTMTGALISTNPLEVVNTRESALNNRGLDIKYKYNGTTQVETTFSTEGMSVQKVAGSAQWSAIDVYSYDQGRYQKQVNYAGGVQDSWQDTGSNPIETKINYANIQNENGAKTRKGLLNYDRLRISGESDRFAEISQGNDEYGLPKTELVLGVASHSLQVQALTGGVKLLHTDNTDVDTLLFPAVTGETKTLATLENPSFSGDFTHNGSFLVKSDKTKARIIEVDSADTNAQSNAFSILNKTSGVATSGFGVDMRFLLYDGVNFGITAGKVRVERESVFNSTNMVFSVNEAGSLRDIIRLKSSRELEVISRLLTPASTTTRAGVNLPHGVEPTVKVNGDKWTTIAGEFTRVNGVTYESAVKSSVGNLQLISLGNTAIGQNTTTNERGHLVRMINGTGATSVKGTLISASTTTDNQFVLQASEFDAFGVVAESGIASGQECWIWVNGSTCEVLWENGQSSTRGYVAICAPTDGRALNIAVPSSNPPVGEHFKEIGHVLQSKTSGTNVLVLCQIHFN